MNHLGSFLYFSKDWVKLTLSFKNWVFTVISLKIMTIFLIKKILTIFLKILFKNDYLPNNVKKILKKREKNYSFRALKILGEVSKYP